MEILKRAGSRRINASICNTKWPSKNEIENSNFTSISWKTGGFYFISQKPVCAVCLALDGRILELAENEK